MHANTRPEVARQQPLGATAARFDPRLKGRMALAIRNFQRRWNLDYAMK
jgi:hypothetical protein